MAIALKTAAGKFLKNSAGKFLSKFRTQYADDKNITMTLRNGSKLMIDTTYIHGPMFSADFDLEVVARDPNSGYPIHCFDNYVISSWVNESCEIYIYDFDKYANDNWMTDGAYGDTAVEGDWIMYNLTPVAVIRNFPDSDLWVIMN